MPSCTESERPVKRARLDSEGANENHTQVSSRSMEIQQLASPHSQVSSANSNSPQHDNSTDSNCSVTTNGTEGNHVSMATTAETSVLTSTESWNSVHSAASRSNSGVGGQSSLDMNLRQPKSEFPSQYYPSQAYPHILPTPSAQSSNFQASQQSSFGVQNSSYPYAGQSSQTPYGLAPAMSYGSKTLKADPAQMQGQGSYLSAYGSAGFTGSSSQAAQSPYYQMQGGSFTGSSYPYPTCSSSTSTTNSQGFNSSSQGEYGSYGTYGQSGFNQYYPAPGYGSPYMSNSALGPAPSSVPITTTTYQLAPLPSESESAMSFVLLTCRKGILLTQL
jgi:hypothetical protein